MSKQLGLLGIGPHVVNFPSVDTMALEKSLRGYIGEVPNVNELPGVLQQAIQRSFGSHAFVKQVTCNHSYDGDITVTAEVVLSTPQRHLLSNYNCLRISDIIPLK